MSDPTGRAPQPRHADLLVRAARVHALLPGSPPRREIAVVGDRIVEVSDTSRGLDAWIGPTTRMIDVPRGTVLPSFDDTHTHLIFAALDAFAVPVHRATSVAEFLGVIRDRAGATRAGQWITTTTNWQELNLAEQRMPTASELDQPMPTATVPCAS